MKPLALAVLLLLATPVAAAAQSGVNPELTGPAWSPYLAGALIGVLSMLTFYFSSKPIGASGAYARVAGLLGNQVAPRHTGSLDYYRKTPPTIDWEVMLVAKAVGGAFLAAWTGNELNGRFLQPLWVERFGDAAWLRVAVALIGGALMAFGARLAGGCTSGHGISGALQLSIGSWIALVCFFAAGVVTANLLYRL